MYYFVSGAHYVMYLSNGVEGSSMHVADSGFIKSIEPRLFKNVIQLNFKDQYRVL